MSRTFVDATATADANVRPFTKCRCSLWSLLVTSFTSLTVWNVIGGRAVPAAFWQVTAWICAPASSNSLPTDLHLLPSRRAISSLFGSSMFAHEKALTGWFVVCCCCYWRPMAIKSHFLCRLHPRNVNSQPNFCSSLWRATFVFFCFTGYSVVRFCHIVRFWIDQPPSPKLARDSRIKMDAHDNKCRVPRLSVRFP